MLKNVADIIQHGAKVVYIVPPCDKDAMLSNYIMLCYMGYKYI